MESPFSREKKSLEDAFYQKESELILKKMREKKDREAQIQSLAEILRLKDPALATHLLELGVTPETALAFRLIPLLEVAWADGHLDNQERDAVLKAAEAEGAGPETPGGEMLKVWLESPPTALVGSWYRCLADLRESLSPEDLAQLRESLLGSARRVAESAGGILGIGSVSATEKTVLAQVEKALS